MNVDHMLLSKSLSKINPQVPDFWLRHILNGKYIRLQKSTYDALVEWDPEQLLAPTNDSLPAGWHRVWIQKIAKSEEMVER